MKMMDRVINIIFPWLTRWAYFFFKKRSGPFAEVSQKIVVRSIVFATEECTEHSKKNVQNIVVRLKTCQLEYILECSKFP